MVNMITKIHSISSKGTNEMERIYKYTNTLSYLVTVGGSAFVDLHTLSYSCTHTHTKRKKPNHCQSVQVK